MGFLTAPSLTYVPISDPQDTQLKVVDRRSRLGPRPDHVREAAEKLSEGGAHSLPVVDENGELAGIVTSID